MKPKTKPSLVTDRYIHNRDEVIKRWFSSPSRQGELNRILRDPFGKDLMEALCTFIPEGYPTTVEAIAIELGRREGFKECLKALTVLSMERKEKESIEMEWANPTE